MGLHIQIHLKPSLPGRYRVIKVRELNERKEKGSNTFVAIKMLKLGKYSATIHLQ